MVTIVGTSNPKYLPSFAKLLIVQNIGVWSKICRFLDLKYFCGTVQILCKITTPQKLDTQQPAAYIYGDWQVEEGDIIRRTGDVQTTCFVSANIRKEPQILQLTERENSLSPAFVNDDQRKLVADWGGVAGQVPSRRQPSDPYSPLFTQSFLSCFPCVLSPVVVLRLLLHRLLTTAAHLQRWKSCASRSSFASASAHDVPRSPRSRASSTDTEPSSLRKRRKVSIENGSDTDCKFCHMDESLRTKIFSTLW